MDDVVRMMDQQAPYPDELIDLVEHCQYRPGWRVECKTIQRSDDGCWGLTLTIWTKTYNSYHEENGQGYVVRHLFGVPAATYNRESWQRWLFERFCEVEVHEAMEFFRINGSRPFAPNHGPGYDPYFVRQMNTDEAQRTAYTGVLNTSGV